MAKVAKSAAPVSTRQITVLVFLLWCAAVAGAQVRTGDLATIVDRMERAALENRAHYRPYVVTREYRMYGSDEQQPKSEVTAEVSFVPPTRKDFRITESNGNSRGAGVVRHILEDESKAAATGTAPGAITRQNYDFELLGEEKLDGRDCFLLTLLPKREDKSLIAGRVWVDKETYLVRRVAGNMAKMPSWWLKSVYVTLDFGVVEGMWLQERTRAVAEVRIAGRHVLTSEAVRIQAGSVEARNLRPAARQVTRPRPFGRSDTVLGAGVLPR